MSKIVLTDVSSGFQLSKINENFQKIEDELNNKVLYRDAPTGEPNALENDLDINGKSLYNVGDISLLGHDGFEEILAETEDARDAAISAATDAQNEAISAAASAIASGASAGEASGFASDAEISALSAAASAITSAAEVGALAASSGAALVGFTQSVTGAVAQTVDSKLKQSISVKDFGAVGDGVADDTAAIQAAINYAATLPRGARIKYPAGRYYLSAGLVQTSPYISHKGDGVFSSLFVTTTNITPLTIGTNPIVALPGVDVIDIGFYHSNAIAKTTPQLVLISALQTTIRCWFQNGAYGCAVYGGQGITFDKVYAPGNYDPGTSAVLNSVSSIVLHAASTLGGYSMGAGAVDLPTEVRFQGIYINGPKMKGWQRGIAIFAGEHISFASDCYVGQSTINNIHIEQDANNKLILEVKIERGAYIDAAGSNAVYVGGPNGDGSQYIGSVSIDADIKGQSGGGSVGIYVDGTARGGSFSQAVRNLSITGHVSGFATHGIILSGGVNISVTGAKSWGNSFNSANNGYGMLIGPNVTGCAVSGGHFGGGTFGDGTGNQTAGIGVDSGASSVTLSGVDLRGNQSALVWTNNADVRGNRVVNCPGYNENRVVSAPSMPSSAVDFYNPYGSPCSVLIYSGTVSSIKLNGTQMFATTVNAPIFVGPGDRLNITYTVAPSWAWWRQ